MIYIRFIFDLFFGSVSGIYFFFALMTMILSIPAWILGKRKNYFHPIEVLFPLVVFLFFYQLNFFSDRVKTLSNLIELPIVALFSLLLNYFKTFVLSKHISLRVSLIALILLNCTVATLIFFLVPTLPE